MREPILRDYQKRVFEEEKELREKIQKLSKFISDPDPATQVGELKLLKQQVKHMERYREVLAERIKLYS